MFAEKFIKNIVRREIRKVLTPIIKDPAVLTDSVDYLTDLAMEVVKMIGIREFIRIIWFAKKKQSIQRVIEEEGYPDSIHENTDAPEDS